MEVDGSSMRIGMESKREMLSRDEEVQERQRGIDDFPISSFFPKRGEVRSGSGSGSGADLAVIDESSMNNLAVTPPVSLHMLSDKTKVLSTKQPRIQSGGGNRSVQKRQRFTIPLEFSMIISCWLCFGYSLLLRFKESPTTQGDVRGIVLGVIITIVGVLALVGMKVNLFSIESPLLRNAALTSLFFSFILCQICATEGVSLKPSLSDVWSIAVITVFQINCLDEMLASFLASLQVRIAHCAASLLYIMIRMQTYEDYFDWVSSVQTCILLIFMFIKVRRSIQTYNQNSINSSSFGSSNSRNSCSGGGGVIVEKYTQPQPNAKIFFPLPSEAVVFSPTPIVSKIDDIFQEKRSGRKSKKNQRKFSLIQRHSREEEIDQQESAAAAAATVTMASAANRHYKRGSSSFSASREFSEDGRMFFDLLGMLPEGIVIFDKQQKMVFSNQTICDLLSCHVKEKISEVILNLSTSQKNGPASTSYVRGASTASSANIPQSSEQLLLKEMNCNNIACASKRLFVLREEMNVKAVQAMLGKDKDDEVKEEVLQEEDEEEVYEKVSSSSSIDSPHSLHERLEDQQVPAFPLDNMAVGSRKKALSKYQSTTINSNSQTNTVRSTSNSIPFDVRKSIVKPSFRQVESVVNLNQQTFAKISSKEIISPQNASKHQKQQQIQREEAHLVVPPIKENNHQLSTQINLSRQVATQQPNPSPPPPPPPISLHQLTNSTQVYTATLNLFPADILLSPNDIENNNYNSSSSNLNNISTSPLRRPSLLQASANSAKYFSTPRDSNGYHQDLTRKKSNSSSIQKTKEHQSSTHQDASFQKEKQFGGGGSGFPNQNKEQLDTFHHFHQKLLQQQTQQAHQTGSFSKECMNLSSSTPHFLQSSVSSSLRIVKRRLVNPRRSNEIIQGETKVSDLLSDIFANFTANCMKTKDEASCGGNTAAIISSQTLPSNEQQVHEALKATSVKQMTTQSSIIGVSETAGKPSSPPPPLPPFSPLSATSKPSKHEFRKSKTFFSQMDKDKNLGYMQYEEDMLKVQVRWGSQILVLKFLLFQIEGNGKATEDFILLLVDPLWQEFLNKKIQEVEKYKMKMFASLSHELRTPLNCTISMLEALEQFIHDPMLVNHYLYPALHSQKLLLNQINDILDFAQIDSGKFKYSFVDFNLERLLQDCVTLVEIQASIKSIELNFIFDNRLNGNVKSDPNRIRQILLNFLSNSLKFTPEKGTIRMTAEPVFVNATQQVFIKLSVVDSGIGMKPETLKNIFNAFNKTEYENESINSQGCGLGLAISQSISKGLVVATNLDGSSSLHGCGVQVESTFGVGSNFSFLIQDMAPRQLKPPQSQPLSLSKISEEQLQNQQPYLYESEVQILYKSLVQSVHYTNCSHPSCTSSSSSSHSSVESSSDSSEMDNNDTREAAGKSNSNNAGGDSCFVEVEEVKKQKVQTISIVPFLTGQTNGLRATTTTTTTTVGQTITVKELHTEEDGRIGAAEKGGGVVELDEDKQGQVSIQISQQYDEETEQQNRLQQLQQQHIKKQRKQQKQLQKEESKIKNKGVSTSSFNMYTPEVIGSTQSRPSPHRGSVECHVRNLQAASGFSQSMLWEPSSTTSDQMRGYAATTTQRVKNNLEQSHAGGKRGSVQSVLSAQQSFPSIQSRLMPSTSKMTSNLSRSFTNMSLTKMNSAQGFNGYHSKIQVNEDITTKLLSLLQSFVETPRCEHANSPILIVDDNQFNILALTRLLQQFFTTNLDMAFDGQSALEKINQKYARGIGNGGCSRCARYELIFMDIEMPLLSGYDVIEQLAPLFKRLEKMDKPYIVACTAHAGDEEEGRAKVHGFDDFISKPIMKLDLSKLLCDWFFNTHYDKSNPFNREPSHSTVER